MKKPLVSSLKDRHFTAVGAAIFTAIHRGDRPAGSWFDSRAVAFVVYVPVVVMMLMFAPSALAARAPVFLNKTLELQVHSTRVRAEEQVDAGELATKWKAEYITAQALEEAEQHKEEAKWTEVDSGETEACQCTNIVYIGAHDGSGPAEPNQLRHLNPGTAYFIRFLAENADSGDVLTEEKIPFKTLPIEKPEVAHGGIDGDGSIAFENSELTDTAAAFRAKIESNGAEAKYTFEYAASANGPWTPFTSDAAGVIAVAEDYAQVAAHISGLVPETDYFVRLKISNGQGETIQSKYALGSGVETTSFTTPTAKARAEAPELRNVTADAVHLSGEVAPHGLETEWRFEYAPSLLGPWEEGGKGTISQAEAEALPYGASPRVAARLDKLFAGTTYYVRLVAENATGSINAEPSVFKTTGAPLANAFAIHALHGGSLRLLGAVNPNSEQTSAEQTITIEGAPTAGTFTLAFKGQTTAPIGFDASAENVQSALENLPGSPVLFVEGLNGGPYTIAFTDSDSEVSEPQIVGDGSGLVPSGPAAGAVDAATVFAGGESYDTHFHFQYVSNSGFGEHGWADAEECPEEDAGSGDSPKFVGCDLPGLVPGETYRYRMLASSTAPGTSLVEGAEQSLVVPVPVSNDGASVCPNEALRTGLSAHLPDCRAYEQLTPINKEGAQEPFHYRIGGGSNEVLVGEDGDHVALRAPAVSWGAGPGAGQSPYFFSREEGKGWSMKAGSPQPENGVDQTFPILFSANLEQYAFESEYNGSKLSKTADIEYKVGPVGGPYVTLPSVPRALAVGGWVAESADSSKLIFETEDRSLLGEPTGTKSGSDLYEFVGGALHQLNVNSEGVTIGACGARIVHGRENGAENHSVSGPHSVSNSGSRVFFEAVPGKNCGEPAHLYVREDGSATTDLGTYRFLAADSEGGKLILERVNAEAHEVVLYETASASASTLFTTRETIGNEGPLVISSDLSTVYLALTEQLAVDNGEAPPMIEVDGVEAADLYRFDVASGKLEFLVQTVSTEGHGTSLSVSPDGRFVYFTTGTVGGLPGGLDLPGTGELAGQVYRFDSVESVIECVSCASSFDPEPQEPSFLDGGAGTPFTSGGLPEYQAVSANGDYAFFTTPAALVRQDVDGEQSIESEGLGEFVDPAEKTSSSSDVYEWRKDGIHGCAELQGCLALITDGRGGFQNLLLGTADEGRDVFIYTRSKLLAQDNDTSGDIYDARIDGGFPPAPPSPVECEASACSTPASPPDDVTPSSLTFSGSGNVPSLSAVKPATKVKKPQAKKKKTKPKGKQKTKKGRKKGKKAGERVGKGSERVRGVTKSSGRAK